MLGVPDTMMGEKVGAVIVLRPGDEADRSRDPRLRPASRSPTSRRRSSCTFRAEPLPRNAGGKVLKPVLRNETEWCDQLR